MWQLTAGVAAAWHSSCIARTRDTADTACTWPRPAVAVVTAMLARALVLGPLLLYALVAFAGSVLALARPLPLPARGSDVARSAHGVRALRAGAVVGLLGTSSPK